MGFLTSIVGHVKTTSAANIRVRADQGDVDAQHNLGLFYEKGTGVAQDYSEACKWYFKAAVRGNTVSQLYLGVLVAQGQGVPPDLVEGYKWVNLAAKAPLGKDLSLRPMAISVRKQIAERMTSSQIEQAEQLVRDFVPILA
jgi:hypothetical protein